MKTSKLLTTMGFVVGCLSATLAGAVDVDFAETERFTDFSDSAHVRSSAQEAYVKELTAFLEDRLGDELPPSYHVQVVITDVDMAGEFEPWRRGGFEDVRIVKDLYPPRIDLSFRVLDASGNLVSEGNRKLRNLSFMYTQRSLDSDPLRHEKELLASWIRREFKGIALS
jgi:hypothetical protein